MILSKQDLTTLHTLAFKVAKAAGSLINQYVQSTDQILSQTKESGNTAASQIVTEVDYKVEALIIEQLSPSLRKYDLALLSEEQPDDGERLIKDNFWCIDPLDGTLAFANSKPGYAVSIALVAQDGTPLIGAIFDPVQQTLYSACQGIGAFKNGKPWRPSLIANPSKLTWPCDKSLVEAENFSEIKSLIEDLAKRLGFEELQLINGQGAVLNAVAVLEHSPGIYFKPPKPQQGGGSLWDFAATACLFEELGSVVVGFDGEKLALNREDSTFMNQQGVVFCCDERLLQVIKALQSSKPSQHHEPL